MKVILLMAMTLDGKIARDSNHFPNWTGKQDKRLFVRTTKEAGVIIMGSKTFDTIGKPLPGRLNLVMTRNKDRISHQDNLVFTDKSPRQILADLENRGYKTAVLAGGATVNSIFAKAGLIDEIWVTITPRLFGQGLSLFAHSMDADLELMETRELEPGVVFLKYRVIRDRG